MASLATDSDLEARIGRDLTAAEAARASALLADASALIRAYTGRPFEAVADDEVLLRPVGSHLRLPGPPVTAVGQVEWVGTAGTSDRVMGVAEWAWDGADIIELWPRPVPLVGAPPTGSYADMYRVTYDHGEPAPDDVVAVCCRMTLAVLLAPTMASGLVQERIGQYSYQFGQAPGQASPGATVRMTDADRADLRRYRRTAGTIELRTR